MAKLTAMLFPPNFALASQFNLFMLKILKQI